MPCSRCETLPTLDRAPGRLHFWFPLGHSSTKAVKALEAAGFTPRDGGSGDIVLDIPAGRPELAAAPVTAALTDLECEDTRALYKTGSDAASMADVANVRTLKAFVRLYAGDALITTLEKGRVSAVFQPIVSAKNPGEIHGQEALARGHDEQGRSISPGQMFEEARDTGLLFNLDLACRKAAIAGAASRRFGQNERVFVNFTPTSIYDPNFCLRSTMAAIDVAGIPRENIVFEVIESERAVDTEHLRTILAFYRGAGFKVALDDVGSGYSSLNLVHQLRPDYVKLDMQLIRDVDTDPYKAVIARKLLESAHELGIATIAEGIETAGELAWCVDHGASYVQGYLIARPS